MVNYRIGDVIKKLREQKGLTQAELASHNHDPSTISKIESGKLTPSKKMVYSLLEKLGYDPGGLDIFYLNDNETTTQKIINELDAHLSYDRIDEAGVLIKKLEEDKNFMKNRLNHQYILYTKAACKLLLKEFKNEIYIILKEAIELTIPDFTLNKISEYHLSKQEMKIITNIAAYYFYNDQIDIAILIMDALKENFDKNCIDKDYLGKHYPYIIDNLTYYLSVNENYLETIELCDIGIEVCKNTGYLYHLPHIFLTKAICLCALGEIEEGGKMMKLAYYGHEMYGQTSEAIEIKEYAKDEYGIIIS